MNTPKAILFDLGGTLLGTRQFDPAAGMAELLNYAIDKSRLTPEVRANAADSAAALYQQIMTLRDTSDIEFSIRCLLKILYDRLGLGFSISWEKMELIFWQNSVVYTPEPGVERTLEYLQRADVRMAVVSNSIYSGFVLEDELKKHGLMRYFDFLISSVDYGIKKPHPLFLGVAVDRLGFALRDLWFIGDTPRFDITAAARFGISSIWYNPTNDSLEDFKPEATIGSWDEFLTIASDYFVKK